MKNIKTLFLAVIIATTMLTPKKSEAAIGLATGSIPVIIGGIAVGSSYLVLEKDEYTKWFMTLLITGPLGLIILDGEEDQMIEFSELTPAQAQKMNLTELELASYNSELDQANIILEEVALATELIEQPTQNDTHELWKDYSDYVSPETFSALEKIGHQFSHQ